MSELRENFNGFVMHTTAQMAALHQLLREKGIFTKKEWDKAFNYWTHFIDQAHAQKKGEEMQELEKKNPSMAEALRLVEQGEDPMKAMMLGMLYSAKKKKAEEQE